MARSFQDDLNYSNKIQTSPMWEYIYKQFFCDYQALDIVVWPDPLQSEGVDRILINELGKTRYLEEKADKYPPNNIYLEYVSAVEYNSPGWIEKPVKTDYLIYAYPTYGVAYVIKFKFLKQVWDIHKADWIKAYGKQAKTFSNGGAYTSLGCAVPLNILKEAIDKISRLPGIFMKRIEFETVKVYE
jgi:hypothetical protein